VGGRRVGGTGKNELSEREMGKKKKGRREGREKHSSWGELQTNKHA